MRYVALAALALTLGGAAPPRAASPARGLTQLVGLVNKGAGEVYLRNNETGHSVRLAGGKTVGLREMVPWCASQKDFEQWHTIEITVAASGDAPARHYFVWQSNENWQDRVRHHHELWWKPQAAPIPGASEVNGERVLEVNPDGTLFLRRP